MNHISESDISTLYTSKYMALVNVGDRQTDKKNTFTINLDEDSESIQKHIHYEYMYSSVALIIQFSVSPLVTH